MGRPVDVKSGDLLICFAITFGGRVKCRLTLQCIVFVMFLVFFAGSGCYPCFFCVQKLFLCLLRAGVDEQIEETMESFRRRGMKSKGNVISSYLIITVGTVIMAVGIYFFKFPNHFSTGGVSGLSMILTALFPGLTAGQYMMIFNVLLLIIGLLVFGKSFAVKTVYSSVLLSVCTRVFEVVIPLKSPLTEQKLLELIFAIALTAVGSAMIFNERASAGGTDIVAMILKKYTNLDIGKALLCSDIVLAAASLWVFDIETGMFSILGLVMKAFVVDNVIDGINLSKCFTIITDKDEEICKFINQELHRGATVSVCSGAFTGTDRKMIITVLNRGQAVMLKHFIQETDAHAFTVITNSSDILGKGFRNC